MLKAMQIALFAGGSMAVVQCQKSPTPGTERSPATVGAAPTERIAVPGAAPAAAHPVPPSMATPLTPTAATAPAGIDESFTVDIAAINTAAGTEGIAAVTVHPGKGFKVNLEYPVKLTLDPVADVTLAKSVFEKPDATTFDMKSLAFAVKATAGKAGSYSLKGTLKFAVCTEATCDPKKVPVTIALNAK